MAKMNSRAKWLRLAHWVVICAAAWPVQAWATGFANGGFESDAIGASPPSSWLRQTYLNGGVSGTTSAPPASFATLNLGTPGAGKNETFVVGGTAATQADPDLGTGQTFRFPLFDVRAARVNYLSATDNGKNRNANSLYQTMTVGAGDIDGSDGLVHVRFAIAPVLENPAHGYNQQPYFYVELLNVTKGTTLMTRFNTAGQSGVPWKTTTSVLTGNTTQWTDWQLIDVAPDSSALAVGDQVKLTVVASGCALGGHFGRVYVDGFGTTIPGVYTWATADKASVSAGSTLTYTLHYANGSASSAIGARLDFATPPNTTYNNTVALPTGCTAPANGSAGTISCPLGVLSSGATGAFQVAVNVSVAATGSIVNGNYAISAVNSPTLLGATLATPVIAAPSSGSTADITVSISDGNQALTWGQTGVVYTVTVVNTTAPTRSTSRPRGTYRHSSPASRGAGSRAASRAAPPAPGHRARAT